MASNIGRSWSTRIRSSGASSWARYSASLSACRQSSSNPARRSSWREAKAFARDLAQALARGDPRGFVLTSTKSERRGKIFVDYLRNGFGASAIAPYSTRSREGAPVAAPVTWEELAAGIRPADFTVTSMPRRMAALARDPWHGYFEVKQSIKRRGSPRRAA